MNPQQSVSEGIIQQEQFGPPQPPQGFFDKADKFLEKPSGQFLVNLLAQSGFSTIPQSRIGAVGRAALATRQQGIASRKASSQEDLIRAQIGLTQAGGISPAKIREFKFVKGLSTKDRSLFFKVQRDARPVSVPGAGFGTFDQETGEFIPAVSEDILQSGIGGREGQKEGAKQAAITEAIPEQVGARGAATRHEENINKAISAADSTAVLRRARDLLDIIETGGFANASLQIKQAFGIEGADEAELSANLGKAVLAQLRTTFGAQFTQEEGDRLIRIEAGFGKSTEGNKRLLGHPLKLVERVAQRGIDSAIAVGDDDAAALIKKSLDFNLEPEETPTVFDTKKMTIDELNSIANSKPE